MSLSIGERNALSGVPLLVYVEETPLADVLNALWSQMGYLKALWSWERTGETSPYSYRFVPSLAAKRLSAMMKDEVFSTFEKQVKRLIDAARMTPEERKNLQGDNLTPDYVLNDDRCREGIKILADNLTPSMQQSVLRGKKEITVPIDQLSEAGKKYVQRELDLYNDREAKPKWVRFSTVRMDSFVTPVLMMAIEGKGSYGYAGGVPLDRAIRSEMDEGWMLPGDTRDNALSKSRIAPSREDVVRRLKVFTGFELERRLAEVPLSVPVAIIALLPANQDDPGTPAGLTVDAYLRKLKEGVQPILFKWHGDVLLLRFASWFWEDERFIPYDIIRRLRRLVQRPGELPLTELLRLAAELTSGQLRQLERSLPVLHGLTKIQRHLVFCARNPAVMSMEGAEIVPEMVEEIEKMGIPYRTFYAEGGGRIQIKEQPASRNSALSLIYL